jgi:hypothetical protein
MSFSRNSVMNSRGKERRALFAGSDRVMNTAVLLLLLLGVILFTQPHETGLLPMDWILSTT